MFNLHTRQSKRVVHGGNVIQRCMAQDKHTKQWHVVNQKSRRKGEWDCMTGKGHAPVEAKEDSRKSLFAKFSTLAL